MRGKRGREAHIVRGAKEERKKGEREREPHKVRGA